MPWSKIWSIKLFYATPRDQITWLKIMHRNLFLAGNLVDEDNTCRACEEKENIIHLVQCRKIRKAFWEPLTRLMLAMGFTVPPEQRENEAFWLLGRLTYKDVVSPAQAGIMFIAWRCLYAAIVHSRVDKTPLRLTSAYNRTLQMTITRLRAYGEFWRRWTRINHFTGNKSVFPENKRKRVVIKMAADSTYTIHYLLLQEYHATVSVARQASI